MASNEDTDVLYADLYGADGSGAGEGLLAGDGGEDNAHASDEQKLIGYDEDDHNKADNVIKPDQKSAPAASTGSFIPPPSTAAPAQAAETGLQIKGSFIPPPAASSVSHSHSDVRDLTPASHNDASNNQQSASTQSQTADGGDGAQAAGAEGGQGSDNRSVMPHEMPEEGKMFVGGLNWDTTEDSLRRYFSQFGEVGHCTIMRDNMTGRSRGFAFLNFVDPKAVNTVMVREHYLDGKVIDPKRAIPRQQRDNNYNHNQTGGQGHGNYGGGGGAAGGGYSAQSQKLFVGGLPPTVTPASFRMFFEQFGTLAECTCMMDRETGKPRGFGFLTYQDDAALQHVLNTRPIVFDGKEVDVKRAQSKNDPQSLQVRRQQRIDNPEMSMGGMGGMGGMGMQQGGGRYGMGNNYNAGGGNFGANNAWAMNPMMMGMGGDPNAMAQMYQSMGWGKQNWNPLMAWQQMMASTAGQASNAGGAGMDMGAMMNSMGMGGMGMMGGMGNMSPPMNNAMSPNMQSATVASGQKASSNNGDDRTDRSGSANAPSSSRFQRGGGFNNNGGVRPPTGPKYDRERSPNRGSDDRNGGGGYRRERSPNRRDEGRRYDIGNRNRY